MVVIGLQNSGGNEVRRMGPFPWVRLHADSLRAGPGDEEIGRLRGGVWHAADRSGTKLHMRGSCCSVRFEAADGAESHGPFEQVDVIDGAIYTQPGRVLLARLDGENNQWYAYDGGRWWPDLVVEKCDGGEPA